MIQALLTAMAILGMVIQPVALARPANMQAGSLDQQLATPVQNEMNDHAMMPQMADDEMPCHEAEAEPAASCEDCCDTECSMNKHCRTSGVQVPGIVHGMSPITHLNPKKLFHSLYPNCLKEGAPGFIEHPPKHA